MSLATKTKGPPRYVPVPLELVKERRNKPLVVHLPPIRWEQLSEEDYWAQWTHFLNTMHNLENENTITIKDLFPVFVQYLRIRKYSDAQIAVLKLADERDLTYSIVSKAYLLMMTGVDHPAVVQTDKWITSRLKSILERSAKVDTEVLPEVPRRTIQDFKRDKRSELLGDLQGLEDEMTDVSILQFLKERAIAKEHLYRIEEIFAPRLAELKEVLSTKDVQLKEAYSAYRKPEIMKMIEWYERLLHDVAAYRNVKVSRRTLRVSKPKPPAKVVAKLKYMVASDEFNINSTSPTKLVGAASAWLYNTKTRKLIVYYASDYEKQLTVKGTYIVGWDPITSMSKTLRQPKDQLAEFMKTIGKVAQRNFIKDLKGKQATLKGRVNSDMLILKVT